MNETYVSNKRDVIREVKNYFRDALSHTSYWKVMSARITEDSGQKVYGITFSNDYDKHVYIVSRRMYAHALWVMGQSRVSNGFWYDIKRVVTRSPWIISRWWKHHINIDDSMWETRNDE